MRVCGLLCLVRDVSDDEIDNYVQRRWSRRHVDLVDVVSGFTTTILRPSVRRCQYY